MTTRTTGVSHYHVQKSRRAKFFGDWRNNRREVVVGIHRHSWDAMVFVLSETMRALCDPLALFEEPPTHVRDKQAGDPSTIECAATSHLAVTGGSVAEVRPPSEVKGIDLRAAVEEARCATPASGR